MKKLINRPDRVVREMMQGFAALYPDTLLIEDAPALIRADADELRDVQVALVSGGGSGHEPAHAGYVGAGMLSAAVAGEVFTSPSPDAVFAAIRAVGGKAGVVLIVKNYTGDRLNFGIAAEMARAAGIPVAIVIVADDVALAKSLENTGARGLAGTVLVHKIAGAAAAEGKTLTEVASLAQEAANEISTMGLALSAGVIPAAGKPSFELGPDELELGLGIHGEPGVERGRVREADELIDELLTRLLEARAWSRGEHVAVLINNLGSTTAMELAIVSRRVMQVLSAKGLVAARVHAGTFLTSLEAAGISLSLLRLDAERLKYLDAPTTAPAWPNGPAKRPSPVDERTKVAGPDVPDTFRERESTPHPSVASRAILAACKAIRDAAPELTELDRATGDGDLGTNLARGAAALELQLEQAGGLNAVDALRLAGGVLQRVVGGSSGPLYSILLLRTANAVSEEKVTEPRGWAQAALAGCEAVMQLGGAKAGDRTMLDALLPFARTLKEALENGVSPAAALRRASAAAQKGAASTAAMMPRFGRASYLGSRALGHSDAGAVAASVWLRAVAAVLGS